MQSQPEINTSNISLFSQPNPNNVFNGLKKGLGNLLGGTVAGIGLIFIGPIKGGIDGYNRYGVCGAVGGTFAGLVLGSLCGAVVILGGTLTCAWQTLYGLARTPVTTYSLAVGKNWDEDAQEWNYYDLQMEKEKLQNMTEEEFMRIVTEAGSAAPAFSQFSPAAASATTATATSTADGSDAAATAADIAKRPKKDILDRELYDTLGVEPEATAGEIKKAYYVKARQNHPDRNPGDAQANANFQKIGQAYQVLADDKLRQAYDTKGKAAVEGNNSMDAGAMFMMIFGSENFEPIVGELYVALQIRLMTEPTKPVAVLRFRQRKRELTCALTLAARLDEYTEADEQVFIDKARSEASDLAESSLGAALLSLVGSVYIQRANAHLSTVSALALSTARAFKGISDFFAYSRYGFSTISSALEMRSLQAEAAAKQVEEDERNNVSAEERRERDRKRSPMDMGMLYGPNPSEDQLTVVQEKTRRFGANILGLLWQLTKGDIDTTIKNVCKKVLRDRSVSQQTRDRRAKALLLLGVEYCRRSVQEQQAISDFLERIGQQTGLFGQQQQQQTEEEDEEGEQTFNPCSGGGVGNEEEKEDASRSGAANANKGAQFSMDISELSELISRVDSMSVRELKQYISLLGGDPDSEKLIEKSDLRSRLNALLGEKFNEQDLS